MGDDCGDSSHADAELKGQAVNTVGLVVHPVKMCHLGRVGFL